jgi:hypothetical protein
MHYEGEGSEAAENYKKKNTDKSNEGPGKGYTGTNVKNYLQIALLQRFVDCGRLNCFHVKVV